MPQLITFTFAKVKGVENPTLNTGCITMALRIIQAYKDVVFQQTNNGVLKFVLTNKRPSNPQAYMWENGQINFGSWIHYGNAVAGPEAGVRHEAGHWRGPGGHNGQKGLMYYALQSRSMWLKSDDPWFNKWRTKDNLMYDPQQYYRWFPELRATSTTKIKTATAVPLRLAEAYGTPEALHAYSDGETFDGQYENYIQDVELCSHNKNPFNKMISLIRKYAPPSGEIVKLDW